MYKDVIKDHTVHGCGWTPNCPLRACCGEAGLPGNHGRQSLCQGALCCAAAGTGSQSAEPLPLCFALSPLFLCCKILCCSGQSPETSNRCFCPKYQGVQAPAASPNEEWKALIGDPIILYNKGEGNSSQLNEPEPFQVILKLYHPERKWSLLCSNMKRE